MKAFEKLLIIFAGFGSAWFASIVFFNFLFQGLLPIYIAVLLPIILFVLFKIYGKPIFELLALFFLGFLLGYAAVFSLGFIGSICCA